MNELVSVDRGILVNYNFEEPRHSGINYYVDSAHLEQVIEQVIIMSNVEKIELKSKAKQWFIDNDEQFKQRFSNAIKQLF